MLKFKKNFFVQFIVLILFLFSISVFAQNNLEIDQLAKLLQGFKTYQADFTQLTYDGKGEITQRSRGRMMIKKPGGFRWESDSPTKQILITDGKTLWNYNVDLAQATKRTLNQKASVNPATLLSGSIKDLTQGFHITQLSKGNMKIFLLKPKKKVVSFQWVQLKFLNKKLTQMKVLNHLDETSIFSFKHIRLNKTLSPQLFHFKPPAGVDVVNQ